jgi:hypothetical protein
MCKIDILLVQGQCKPNAESSLFAEAKPVLAGDFLKSPAKVVLFAHTAKQIAQNRLFCAHFGDFVQSYNSKKLKAVV